MFRTAATIDHDSSPVLSDWTIRQVLEWIAADDTRCLDVRLLGTLRAIDDALSARAGAAASVPHLSPRSPAPLVRSIAARLRAEPALGDTRVAETRVGETRVAETRVAETRVAETRVGAA